MIPFLQFARDGSEGYQLGDPGNPVPTNPLVCWYDFTAAHVWDGADGTGNNGQQAMAVQSVTDLSSNARFLNQSTSGDRPQWTGGVVGLTSQAIKQVSSDVIKTGNITLANATSLTFAIVLKPAAYGSGTETFCGFRSNATPALTVGGIQRTAAKTWQVFGRDGSANIVANALLGITADTDPIILVGVIDVGVGLRLYAAYGETFGLVATTANAGTTTGMTTNPEPIVIFSRSSTFVDGAPAGSTAHELLLYKFALSSDQAYSLMSQLVAKHFVGAGGGASPSSLRDGLDYQYLMNETSGSRYNSGALGNGVGTLLESSPGTVTRVSIDGSLAAQMAANVGDLRITSDRFNMASSFSVTGWFSQSSIVDDYTFIQYTDGVTEQYRVYTNTGTDHLELSVTNGSGTPVVAVAAPFDAIDTPTYIAVIFDINASEIVIYNGASANPPETCVGITSVPGGTLYVCRNDQIAGHATVGKLRVYSRALTAAEVAIQYAEGP